MLWLTLTRWVYFLKIACFFVFPHLVPIEIAAVHHHIDPGRQGLQKSEGTPEVEKTVGGSAESIRHHGPGEHDGFVFKIFGSEVLGRFHHRVCAVGEQYFVARALSAAMGDDLPVGLGHFQTVDHHQCPHIEIDGAPPPFQHGRQVRFPEIQPARNVIVVFVKGAPRDEYLNHIDLKLRYGKWPWERQRWEIMENGEWRI